MQGRLFTTSCLVMILLCEHTQEWTGSIRVGTSLSFVAMVQFEGS